MNVSLARRDEDALLELQRRLAFEAERHRSDIVGDRMDKSVGAEMLSEFEDGVWLVQAAPIRDESALSDEVYRALQLDPRKGPHQRHALLLLDNCEHLREPAARVARSLIEQVEGLHVLATSREALGLRGERVYPVRSMSLPPAGTAAEAE